jgi:hypothetical protein
LLATDGLKEKASLDSQVKKGMSNDKIVGMCFILSIENYLLVKDGL